MYKRMFGLSFVAVLCFSGIIIPTFAIRCYQCSSGQDPEGQDNCGAYRYFYKDQHTSVDCNSDESVTPGTFCVKITQQGPKGFIWDGRWRQVIRRCASVADTGVTGVCNWGVYENGVYWEECYCSEDGCNGATSIKIHAVLIAGAILSFFAVRWH